MTIYRKNILIIFILITILIPLLLFVFSVLVEAAEAEESSIESDINKIDEDNNYSQNQILYSLEIVELTERNLTRSNLESLAYTENKSEPDFNLIKRDELTEIYGEEFETILDFRSESDRSDTIFAPQIVVAPFHTGILRVAQEELLLDVESVDSIVYTNVFELIVEPRGSYDRNKKAVFTSLDLQTGEGPTGLETEVWIEKETPYLLGIMERYREKIEKNISGGGSETRKRYFALYLSARPAGILTLPDLSSSLYGLDALIKEPEEKKSESSVNLRLGYLDNEVSEYGFTLDGFVINDNTAFTLNIDQSLTKRHALGVMGRSYQDLWLGAEVIALEGEDYKVALTLRDSVDLKILKLTAGVNPLVYDFEERSDPTTWFFRGDTRLTKNLNVGLEYRGLEEYDFAECSVGYQFSENYGIKTGYTWNVDKEEEDSIWLGMDFNF